MASNQFLFNSDELPRIREIVKKWNEASRKISITKYIESSVLEILEIDESKTHTDMMIEMQDDQADEDQ